MKSNPCYIKIDDASIDLEKNTFLKYLLSFYNKKNANFKVVVEGADKEKEVPEGFTLVNFSSKPLTENERKATKIYNDPEDFPRKVFEDFIEKTINNHDIKVNPERSFFDFFKTYVVFEGNLLESKAYKNEIYFKEDQNIFDLIEKGEAPEVRTLRSSSKRRDYDRDVSNLLNRKAIKNSSSIFLLKVFEHRASEEFNFSIEQVFQENSTEILFPILQKLKEREIF